MNTLFTMGYGLTTKEAFQERLRDLQKETADYEKICVCPVCESAIETRTKHDRVECRCTSIGCWSRNIYPDGWHWTTWARGERL